MPPSWISRTLPLAFFACALGLAACEKPAPEIAPDARPKPSAAPAAPEPADLVKQDLVVGTGQEAKTGDKVKVDYTGRLESTNFMFDTSVGKKPFEFTLGQGSVIKGWDQGVVGMKVGGKRKLVIPSRLGYGEAGSPPKIPGKSTLVFEVTLLAIEDKDAGAPDAGKDAKGKPAK